MCSIRGVTIDMAAVAYCLWGRGACCRMIIVTVLDGSCVRGGMS